mmetsp:Transcript_67276/g.157852  ORF Transcript_67276/g.157852 Transcript_67276/m.157852 type:complete len:298 (+) Transcript_67276:48-941(+)
MTTEPPDAATWEYSAVAYVSIALALLIAIHVYFECKGRMRWHTISWKHVSESSRGLSLRCMAIYRLCCFFIVAVTDAMMVLQAEDSPLVSSWMAFATFTVWSWTLIGFYNLLAAFASISDEMGIIPASGSVAKVFCCSAWILFEVLLPVSCLICLLVWSVLLPLAYQTYGNDSGLLSVPALAAHNLNFIFMLTETFLNRLCITSYHLVFMFYYGGLYVIFSWFFFAAYQFFFYFFIDWRYSFVLIGYTGLLCLLAIFFFIGRCIVNCIKPSLYTWELDLQSSTDCDGTSDSSDVDEA